MSDWSISKRNLDNKKMGQISENASKFLGGILGDISSRSAYSQIAIGATSGW